MTLLTASHDKPAPERPVRRILLAEDNPHDQLLLEESFKAENLDVEVESVRDGDRLLDLLRQPATVAIRYGLILLDAHLPRLSSEEVLSRLLAERVEVPVPILVISSLMAESQKRRFLELGARSILVKPLDLDEYIALARNLHSMMDRPD